MVAAAQRLSGSAPGISVAVSVGTGWLGPIAIALLRWCSVCRRGRPGGGWRTAADGKTGTGRLRSRGRDVRCCEDPRPGAGERCRAGDMCSGGRWVGSKDMTAAGCGLISITLSVILAGMFGSGCEGRVAHVQDQALCAFRRPRRHSGCGLVRRCRARRKRWDRRPPGCGGVIKQRIARQGRSGGYRSILLFRRGECCFFVDGFVKSGRNNIRRDELTAFRLLVNEMLGMGEAGLRAALSNGTIMEVVCNG